jgi:peptidoglycan/xylan/chitin deacetylase (PgdA/CDA1 family)
MGTTGDSFIRNEAGIRASVSGQPARGDSGATSERYGKVDLGFRSNPCAALGNGHRIAPKSGVHFWSRCSRQAHGESPVPSRHSFVRSTAYKGAARLVRSLASQQLTVICYHRVLKAGDDRFQGYKPTISASQDLFTQQIDFLRANYDPVSLQDLVAWLDCGQPLPPRPVLVTFDDGYRDNADVAWPIMRERGVPAAIFLATDYIGSGRAFIWDVAAAMFASAAGTRVEVPLIGQRTLSTDAERDAATAAWVDAMKRLPGSTRQAALTELSVALAVRPPEPHAFRHLYLDWSDVLELARQGVAFGGHTCSHPILTSLPADEARGEIEASIDRITEALGSKPLAFAYPNGSARDYSRDHEQVVAKCGVPLAFSLEAGPMRLSEVRANRTAIRRVYVGAQDAMPRFLAKLTGLPRLRQALR